LNIFPFWSYPKTQKKNPRRGGRIKGREERRGGGEKRQGNEKREEGGGRREKEDRGGRGRGRGCETYQPNRKIRNDAAMEISRGLLDHHVDLPDHFRSFSVKPPGERIGT
jgi:hypothetical protein